MDLNERMAKLRQTVESGTARRNEESLRQVQILRAQKAKDWDRILETQPEAAEFITEMGKAFGKLDRVLILDNNEVILDSRNYDSLHDANKRRG